MMRSCPKRPTRSMCERRTREQSPCGVLDGGVTSLPTFLATRGCPFRGPRVGLGLLRKMPLAPMEHHSTLGVARRSWLSARALDSERKGSVFPQPLVRMMLLDPEWTSGVTTSVSEAPMLASRIATVIGSAWRPLPQQPQPGTGTPSQRGT